ncbi:MAG: hypothetical protein MRZ79_08610 [Bacteroidia bacterium]|nr:hypothetical protein [Bacteroidia bacterium]
MSKILIIKHYNSLTKKNGREWSAFGIRFAFMLLIFIFGSFGLRAQVGEDDIFKQRAGQELEDVENGENTEGEIKGDTQNEDVGTLVLNAAFVKVADPLAPGAMFFNVLKIDNTTDQKQVFKVNFEHNPRCNLIIQGGDKGTIELAPGASKYMPVRLSFPTDALGGVNYPLTAKVLADSDGKRIAPLVKADISFEQVCKWLFTTPESKMFVSSSDQKFVEIPFKIKNSGNCPEKTQVTISLGADLESPMARLGKIKLEIPVTPSKDTTFTIDVRPKKGSSGGEGSKLIATAVSPFDTVAQELGVSFEVVDDEFINELKEEEAPLILSFNQSGFNEEGQSNIAVAGKILLTGDRDISYRYETGGQLLGPNPIDAKDLLWNKARMMATYSTNAYRFSLGDVSGGRGISVSGRGVKLAKGFGKEGEQQHRVGVTLVKGVGSPSLGLAAEVSSKFSKTFSAFGGFTYNRDKVNMLATTAPTAGFDLGIGQNARLSASGIFTTQAEMGRATDNKSGVGFNAEYGYSKDRLKFKAKSSYGSKDLANGDAGTFKLNARADYDLGKMGRLGVSYNNIRTLIEDENPDGSSYAVGNKSNEVIKAAYNVNVGKISLGAGVTNRTNKQKYSLLGGGQFYQGSRTYQLGAGTKLKMNNSPEKYIAPSVVAGMTQLTRHNTTGDVYHPKYYFLRAGLKGQYKSFAFNALYDYGLKQGINDVFFYEGEGSIYQQRASVAASHRYESADERFTMGSEMTFDYDINEQVAQMKLATRAEYAFKSGWSLSVGAGSKLKDLFKKKESSGQPFSIADMISVNAGAKKVFDFDQPRLKYYNLRLHFFKDANGNKKWEHGEEGIANILVKVERTKEPVMTKHGPLMVKFKPPNIMSDKKGLVEVAKAPHGSYLIHLEELFRMTDYANLNSFHLEVFLNMNKTILVPYSKSVTIEGKIKITRDKFSRLHGISPANIRVTVIDQNGDKHYALTNATGTYMITVPYSETYTVKMKNVLGSKFELIGEEQEIKSEDEKSRYAVGFHFKEKGRGINFGN